jgi:hypothetical protein
MKGLAMEQIALIIIAFIVLAGLIYVFIFLGWRPFQPGTTYAKCTNLTCEFCRKQPNPTKCWEDYGCKDIPMPC